MLCQVAFRVSSSEILQPDKHSAVIIDSSLPLTFLVLTSHVLQLAVQCVARVAQRHLETDWLVGQPAGRLIEEEASSFNLLFVNHGGVQH